MSIQSLVDILHLEGFKVLELAEEAIIIEAPNGKEYVLCCEEPDLFHAFLNDPDGEESDPDPVASGTLLNVLKELELL